MTEKYILDADGRPVQCDDLMAWAWWMETADRRVALTVLGDVRVSTVFLGLDHNFYGGVPLLFETMVFGGPLNDETNRYATRDEAIEGHERIVRLVTAQQTTTRE